MKKIAFFDTKSYDKYSFNSINTKYEITYFEEKLSVDNVILAKGFDAVCCFVNDKVNNDVLDRLNEYGIHVLLLRCSGYNNVNIEYAYKLVHILRVPAYAPVAIGEHAFALILALNRKIHKAYNRTREFNFNIQGLTGFNLYNKTIGIIGTGKIGQSVIDIAKGFGMRVLGYDIFPYKSLDIEYVSLDELYENSDIITIHAPLTEENYHMIDKKAINKMKDGVMIINTSRGGLINSKDLLDSLQSGKVGSAGLDVYEEEANLFFEDKSEYIIRDDVLSLLLSLPNVIITSHQAYLTKEALEEIARITLSNLDKYFNNEYIENEVCYKCKKNPKKCFSTRTKRCW